MTRRELLASASVCIATGLVSRAFSGPTNDLDFASALDAAAAIKAKQVSSLELTRRMIARIDRYNPKLNAFAYQASPCASNLLPIPCLRCSRNTHRSLTHS